MGSVRAGLVEAGRGLSVVSRVEAEDGQDGHGLVVGGVEALVVVDAEVVSEPDNGSSTNSSPIVGVQWAARAQSERVLERISGDGGLERELGGGCYIGGGGEGEMGQGGGLGWDLDLAWLRREEGGHFGLLEKVGGED